MLLELVMDCDSCFALCTVGRRHSWEISLVKFMDCDSCLALHCRQKMQLEQEKSQKSADIKVQNSEVQALQKELDSITMTLKQLEDAEI